MTAWGAPAGTGGSTYLESTRRGRGARRRLGIGEAGETLRSGGVARRGGPAIRGGAAARGLVVGLQPVARIGQSLVAHIHQPAELLTAARQARPHGPDWDPEDQRDLLVAHALEP